MVKRNQNFAWVGVAVGIASLLGILVKAAIVWGAHEQLVHDQGMEIERLRQIMVVNHPDTARAFGENR